MAEIGLGIGFIYIVSATYPGHEQRVESLQQGWKALTESSDDGGEPVKDKKRKYTKKDREKLKNNAGGVCEYCGDDVTMEPGSGKSMEGGHIDPWANGGPTNEDNGASSCRDCNRAKGKKTLGGGKDQYNPSNPSDRIRDKMDGS